MSGMLDDFSCCCWEMRHLVKGYDNVICAMYKKCCDFLNRPALRVLQKGKTGEEQLGVSVCKILVLQGCGKSPVSGLVAKEALSVKAF